MIEKLSEYEITSRDGSFINVECNTKIINTLVRKINELVDAVNEMQESQNTYWTDIAEIKKELQTRAENVQPDAESRPENVITDKDYITITADDVLVGGESVREYNGEKIYNYYHLPAYFKEIRDDVAEKGIKLLEIHCLQSSTDGEYAKTGNPMPDKDGCSAWCRCVWEKDGEKHIGSWVFFNSFSSAAYCAYICANHCAYAVRAIADFRSAVFGGQD